MIPAQGNEGATQEKSEQDNAKIQQRHRTEKLIVRWRIAVGIFFIILIAILVTYLIKGINWTINSSPSSSGANTNFILKGNAEPNNLLPMNSGVFSHENIVPVCPNGLGDTFACPEPLTEQATDSQQARVNPQAVQNGNANSASTPGTLQQSPQSGTCPDFLGDQFACIPNPPGFSGPAAAQPINAPRVLGASTQAAQHQATQPESNVRQNNTQFNLQQPPPSGSCPDFLGDQFACVPNPSNF